MDKNEKIVRKYHEQTKHRPDQYAAGPGYMDWDNQPNPIRDFKGTKKLSLPLVASKIKIPFDSLYTGRGANSHMFNFKGVAALFENSLALTAVKEYGDNKYALRANPSSGNLHPTEAYLIASNIPGIPDGVFHYLPYEHSLEQRLKPESTFTKRIFGRIFIALTTISWREEWKYGERAFRYCQLDTGHAIAAIRYSAAALGWRTKVVSNISDSTIEKIVGLDRDDDFLDSADRETAEVLIQIEPRQGHMSSIPAEKLENLAQSAKDGEWFGEANQLSNGRTHRWPVVADVAQAASKGVTEEEEVAKTPFTFNGPESSFKAVEIIRSRRSAQQFDGKSELSLESFFRVLKMTLPRNNTAPFDALDWSPRIHPLLFVHSVENLAPGIYCFPRNSDDIESLKAEMKKEFLWRVVEGSPKRSPLYLLKGIDTRKLAMSFSCFQDIAAYSAFTLGLIAKFNESISAGPWWYRRLYWEAGMIGQTLYLEAEAAGMRGTGIGCFFDDQVHEIAGLSKSTWQSLYHFTVGSPVEDKRLKTIEPYEGRT